jgi:hypothetical protein
VFADFAASQADSNGLNGESHISGDLHATLLSCLAVAWFCCLYVRIIFILLFICAYSGLYVLGRTGILTHCSSSSSKVSGFTPTAVFALATPKSPIDRGGRCPLQLYYEQNEGLGRLEKKCFHRCCCERVAQYTFRPNCSMPQDKPAHLCAVPIIFQVAARADNRDALMSRLPLFADAAHKTFAGLAFNLTDRPLHSGRRRGGTAEAGPPDERQRPHLGGRAHAHRGAASQRGSRLDSPRHGGGCHQVAVACLALLCALGMQQAPALLLSLL